MLSMNKTQITTYWQELPWNEIKLKANKHLPKFVFILFIILIIQTFAELTWEIFTPSEKSTSDTVHSTAVRVNTAPQIPSLKNVSEYHLFGDAKQQVIVQHKVIDVPEKRLRLDLIVVFASSNEIEELAIICSVTANNKT